MHVLVTGAGGFLGGHLCRRLTARGARIVALGQPSSAARGYVDDFVKIHGLPQQAFLEDVLKRFRPAAVFHLAGRATAPSLRDFYETNLFYAADLLQACRTLSDAPRIVIAGSAAEYGRPQAVGRLMNERDVAQPLTAYGETKLAQTVHAMQRSDLPVTVARIFNPIGEGLPVGRAAAAFVAKAKALEAQGGGVVETGHLDGVRDVADVADVVEAMINLAGGHVPAGEIYNLCTGSGMSMRDITDALQRLLPYEVSFRPGSEDGGIDWAVGNPRKLAAHNIEIRSPDLEGILSRMLADISPAFGGDQ